MIGLKLLLLANYIIVLASFLKKCFHTIESFPPPLHSGNSVEHRRSVVGTTILVTPCVSQGSISTMERVSLSMSNVWKEGV